MFRKVFRRTGRVEGFRTNQNEVAPCRTDPVQQPMARKRVGPRVNVPEDAGSGQPPLLQGDDCLLPCDNLNAVGRPDQTACDPQPYGAAAINQYTHIIQFPLPSPVAGTQALTPSLPEEREDSSHPPDCTPEGPQRLWSLSFT